VLGNGIGRSGPSKVRVRKWRVASGEWRVEDREEGFLSAQPDRPTGSWAGKKRRAAPFEMTVLGNRMGKRRGDDFAG